MVSLDGRIGSVLASPPPPRLLVTSNQILIWDGRSLLLNGPSVGFARSRLISDLAAVTNDTTNGARFLLSPTAFSKTLIDEDDNAIFFSVIRFRNGAWIYTSHPRVS